MIIDTHVHVWPDEIASRALAAPRGDLTRFGDGTVSGALAAMDQAGIDKAITLNVANLARHVERTNTFAESLPADRFIGFGTIHPDLSVEENLASLERHNIPGVKIHPLFQGFALDDRRLWDILDPMRGTYVCIIHVGEGGDSSANDRCTPEMLRNLIEALPGLDVVACHFGGYRRHEEAAAYIQGLPVYLDTSWPPGLVSVAPEIVRDVVRRHGADRIVFGSDWPMSDPEQDVDTLRRIGLTDEEVHMILGGNMANLLGLSSP